MKKKTVLILFKTDNLKLLYINSPAVLVGFSKQLSRRPFYMETQRLLNALNLIIFIKEAVKPRVIKKKKQKKLDFER